MSTIPSLTSEVQQLGSKVDFWNTVIIVCLIATALSAVGIVVTQQIAFRRASELADKQGELAAAKELQLQGDLASKDVKIKEAGAAAETARADAARAGERAALLEKEAAEAKLATEKLKQVVAWRTISSEMAAILEKELSAKPGKVNLRWTDGDPESLFLAIQVSKILDKAKWQVAPGAVKPANGIQFGICLPTAEGGDAQSLRAAFRAAGIEFCTSQLPGPAIGFSITTIPGAPVIMIGSRAPVVIR